MRPGSPVAGISYGRALDGTRLGGDSPGERVGWRLPDKRLVSDLRPQNGAAPLRWAVEESSWKMPKPPQSGLGARRVVIEVARRPPGWPPHRLLEQENDLLGAYYACHGDVPARQTWKDE